MFNKISKVTVLFNKISKVTVLLLGIVFGYFYMGTIGVESHHQGDYFPIEKQYYKLELRAEATGSWTWSYEERCNQGNIRDAVQGSFLDTESRYGVRSIQSQPTNQPLLVQNNVSTCGTDFTGRCGAGFAVACVGADGARFPVNCDAYYDGPYMATFVSLSSKMSVVKHEYTHCRDGRAEGYCDVQESIFPCNTGVICQPSPSIMGCGPNHPLDYSSYDDAAFKVRHYPPKLPATGYGNNGKWYLFACGFHESAISLAVLVDDLDGKGIHWSGVTTTIPTSTSNKKGDANGCMGVGEKEGLTIRVGSIYYLMQENKFSEFRNFNEVCVKGSIGC